MEKKLENFLNKEYILDNLVLEPAYCYKPKGCYVGKLPLPYSLIDLLPYLNPLVKTLYYHLEEEILIFKWNFRQTFYKVTLKPKEIKVEIVKDTEEVEEVLFNLFSFLKGIEDKKEWLLPNFQPYKRPSALEIYKILPKTNCRDCGELSCLALATKISIGEAELRECPHLSLEISETTI